MELDILTIMNAVVYPIEVCGNHLYEVLDLVFDFLIKEL
jgi:hypothetical protein